MKRGLKFSLIGVGVVVLSMIIFNTLFSLYSNPYKQEIDYKNISIGEVSLEMPSFWNKKWSDDSHSYYYTDWKGNFVYEIKISEVWNQTLAEEMLNSLAKISGNTVSFLSSYKNQVSRQQGCDDQCIFSGGYESFKSCSDKCVHEEDYEFRYEIINKTSENRISKIILTKDIIEELVYLEFNCKDSKKAAFIFYTASRNKISNDKFLEIQSKIEATMAC